MKQQLFEFSTGYSYDPVSDEALKVFGKWRDDGHLGFLELPSMDDLFQETAELAYSYSKRFDSLFVAGIGGSSLGLKAILSAFCLERGSVQVVDSPDSDLIKQTVLKEAGSNPAICVITKSGGTAETLSIFMELRKHLGADKQVIAITDPVSGELRKLAESSGWDSLPVPSNVGGRFSVLSPVGMFPALFAGADCQGIIKGAELVRDDFDKNGAQSLAGRIASAFLSRFSSHPVHVFMPYSERLFNTALWFAQLWAESLGKARNLKGETVNTGQTPLPCRGPADQHSLVQLFMEGPCDKTVTIISERFQGRGEARRGEFSSIPTMGYLVGRNPDELRSAEADATAAALEERELPVSRFFLKDISGNTMGQLFMSLEIATALCGLAMGINPLDQPGVERGKVLTYRAMGREGY